MKLVTRNWPAVLLLSIIVLGIAFSHTPSRAQDAASADLAVTLGRCIATKVVTIKVTNQRGEPREFNGVAKFDRPVQAYWVALVGSDVKFSGNTEKQINRQLVNVDPYAKLIDGSALEISGKLGIRDGSGNWDDTYEGTITVAVTAILSSR